MTEIIRLGLMQSIRELGAAQVAILPVSEITFYPDFRKMCQSNACGMYGKCWMCPPAIGEAADLIAQAEQYQFAMVYQTVAELEDSFDIEGMLQAGERQNALADAIRTRLETMGEQNYLHLGAGGCRQCEICAKAEGQPCRFPQRAMSSLEAYCIDVSLLAKSCGMNYINGVNTVTYFGALLLHD